MAVPGIIISPQRVMGTAATLLFERLPDGLFKPLSSANRHKYWALLCHLHEKRFGPNAPLPPSRGFSSREIIQDIEDEILTQNAWELEDSETPETPINIRAIGVFNRFLDSGWFRKERHGVDHRVTMAPAVSQFLTVLVLFAETGPVFVSGKIRSIDFNIQQIIQGNAGGDTLSETADQARNLLEHVRNTGTNIRDIMEALGTEATTAHYVRRFFGEYIERVFIGDYRELRTKEHPLSRRAQILRALDEIHSSDEHRERLVSWYQAKRCAGDRRKAEEFFEKDIYRIGDLKRIDEYLDRLDDEIRRANRRALAFLDYRLRSLRPIDHMIKDAITAALAGKLPELGNPFPAGEMISSERLAEPRKIVERPAPSSLRRQVPSDEERARAELTRRARERRSMSPLKLTRYVAQKLGEDEQITSGELDLKSVEDVRAYQALATIGFAMSSKSRRLQATVRTMAKGFDVQQLPTNDPEGTLIIGRPFIVKRRKIQGKPQKEKA